jgi:hypothetical protein
MTVFRFRWILLIAVGLWVFLVACYGAGAIRIKDFSFVHTGIAPLVLLTVLAPTSIRSVASWRLFAPLYAAWAGVMMPLVNAVGEQITGLEHHCAPLFLLGGAAIFVILMLRWLTTRSRVAAQLQAT